MNTEFVSASFRTKVNILEALNTLVQTRPYEDVGILDICEGAQVSRSTFYHHFNNKDAVTSWHSAFVYSAGIDRIGRTMTWFSGHLATTRAFEEYRLLYAKAAKSDCYDSPRPTFIRHRIKTLQETATDYHGATLTPELEFQIEALAYAEASLSRKWLMGQSPVTSIKDYCNAMVGIVPRELYELIKEPSETPASMAVLVDELW